MADTSTSQTHLPLDQRDARYEAKFHEWNLTFRFEPAFPVEALLAADWAQVRQSNHQAPQDEVEEYRQQMANGAMFPPVIVMSPDTLIDGNTRLGATKKLHRKTIAAYLVEFPSVPMAKSLAGAINNMGGKRLSPDEAAEAAKLLMDMGFADEAIAREIGRSVEQVRRLRNQAEFVERSRKLHLDRLIEDITPDNRARLNSVKHDPVLGEFVQFVAQAAPAKKTVTDLLKQVQTAASDTEAISAIQQAVHDYKPAGPPPRRGAAPVSDELRQLRMVLGQLVKLSANPQALYDPRVEEREERIQQWQQVGWLSEKMLELYGAEEVEPVEGELVTA